MALRIPEFVPAHLNPFSIQHVACQQNRSPQYNVGSHRRWVF